MKLSALLVVGVGANIDKWESWKLKHARHYEGEAEELHRFKIFLENVHYMETSNSRTDRYKLGTNQFSDMSNEEYSRAQCNCDIARPSAGVQVDASKMVGKIASSIDWTTKGIVTPVKDQGSCGACWAFSDTGAMESAQALYHNTLTSLSEQQIVSCYGNGKGCQGGGINNGFTYAEQTSLCTEESYPYTATNAKCKLSSGCDTGLKAGVVTGHVNVHKGDENALMAALNLQPVSVGVNASEPPFQHYHSGILDNAACGSNHNHAILAVGYGTEDGQGYFRIKNSWGQGWGDSGFIRLARGIGGLGQCGVLSEPSYPTMNSAVLV